MCCLRLKYCKLSTRAANGGFPAFAGVPGQCCPGGAGRIYLSRQATSVCKARPPHVAGTVGAALAGRVRRGILPS